MGPRKRTLFRSRAARQRSSLRAPARRTWSVRAKIISLLLVPLLALVVMWALATAVTLGPGLDLLDMRVSTEKVGRPARTLLMELQQERKLTVAYLAMGRKNPASVTAQRARSDAALVNFRLLSGDPDARAALSPSATRRLTEFEAQLGSITVLRESVDQGNVDRSGAIRRYTKIIDTLFPVFTALIPVTEHDLDSQGRAILQISRGIEVLEQEDTVVTGALAAGTFNGPDLGQAIQLIGAQRFVFDDTLPELYVTDQRDYQSLLSDEQVIRLAQLEDSIVSAGRADAALPIEAAQWRTAHDATITQLRQFEQRATDRFVERSQPAITSIIGTIAVTGLLGLLAVIVTIVATIRIGRNLIKRLAGLRQAALELAVDRLPSVVARLRHGERVDVAHEAPPLPYGDDEIGQVGHAFNELQRTAINSAVDEANVRRGLNEVFLNIARRSQTLLHRQLSILDAMERRNEDPIELEDLFRVDHLATRMRRHAEDLVILAGAAPGRGWRNPVAIIDVLRGAVSEVEDYARVNIRPMPEIGIAGRAVGDVIHLLAELIENATTFSPPHTRVNVGGEFVAHGFAIEIEDRGLGISPSKLAECNARLAQPPDFDPASSAQLGLFVVARLAARHGIKVALRTSAYGGVTAVALIPEDLVVAIETTAPAAPHRLAVAALPSAPAREVDGESGRTSSRYRELPTGARPAITAPPGYLSTPSSSDRFSVDAYNQGADSQPESSPWVSVTADSAPPYPDIPTQPEPANITAIPADPPSQSGPGRTRAASAKSRVAPTKAASAGAARSGATKAKPRHSRSEVIEPPPSAGADALPRRIRQTSLAPQLRDAPDASTAGDNPTQGPSTRSPEQLRTMMTSFQTGMARGRRDAAAQDDQVGGAPERDAQ